MQLDFALTPSKPEGPKVYSVAEVTSAVRGLVEGQLGEIWVEGEISNHRRQASGHHYFTLKDASSQLTCVLFAGQARHLPGLRLADGLEVQVFGGMTVYEARGQYQMIVRLVRLKGEGALQARFEELKARLRKEGLFDQELKRPLPTHPRRVAVITSPTGAALQDFLKVLWRRSPSTGVLLFPVRVQGAGAAAEIAAALASVGRLEENGIAPVDLVVLTRGGGSMEDLWEFNDEALARAVRACPVPVVSAVGHEVDFTICDFVADFRAPTPSAAAEILSAETSSLLAGIKSAAVRLRRAAQAGLRIRQTRLDGVMRSAGMREPGRRLRELGQRLDELMEALPGLISRRREDRATRLRRAADVLKARHPGQALRGQQQKLHEAARRMTALIGHRIVLEKGDLRRRQEVLAAMDPGRVLQRGYTLTTDQDGRLLKSAAAAARAKSLRVRFSDGEITASPTGSK